MNRNIRVYEVSEQFIRKEEDKERIIFELKEHESTGEREWVYHAPNAQDHTEKQLEIILSKLKELNNELESQ